MLAPYHTRRQSRPDHVRRTRGSLTGCTYPTAMSGVLLDRSAGVLVDSFSSSTGRTRDAVSGMMSDVDWSRVSYMHRRTMLDRRSYVSVEGERP